MLAATRDQVLVMHNINSKYNRLPETQTVPRKKVMPSGITASEEAGWLYYSNIHAIMFFGSNFWLACTAKSNWFERICCPLVSCYTKSFACHIQNVSLTIIVLMDSVNPLYFITIIFCKSCDLDLVRTLVCFAVSTNTLVLAECIWTCILHCKFWTWQNLAGKKRGTQN